MNSRKGFLLFFGIFWSALTLMFDFMTFMPAARQLIALSFSSAPGTILSSEMTRGNDGDGGTTHGVAVRYNYIVAGQEYTGSRYRYGDRKSSDSAWATHIVSDLPPGTRVQVFYNPKDAQDSVLATGLQGSDLFMFAFMTPFNVVMLGFWWSGFARLRQRWFKAPAGGVRILKELRRTRARLSEFSPIATLVITTALLAFFSIFVVGFLGGGFHPPMRTMVITWGVILGGGMIAGLWHGYWTVSGKYDLVIDEMHGLIELPATQGRKTRCRIPLKDVQAVRVDTVAQPSEQGEQSTVKHAPTLILHGVPPSSERLVQWFDKDRAERFAEWLQTKLQSS